MARPAWPAPPATAARISIRRACRAIRTGTWPRRPWPGKGKSLGYICNQLKDPTRNGNRDIAAILKHVSERQPGEVGLEPGAGRTPAPGTNEEFAALLEGLGRHRRALSGALGRELINSD